jgi:bacteriocin-like protein
MSGKKELNQHDSRLPVLLIPSDVDMLQDLIVAAVNEAMHQIDEVSEKEMNKITGGMKLPGM